MPSNRANEAIPAGRSAPQHLNPLCHAAHNLPFRSGGFACCYEAKWERGAETRRIALKVLLPAHSSPDCLYWTQFLQEAALLRSVQHRWGTAPCCSCNRSYAGRTDVEAACTSSRSAISLPSRWSLHTPVLVRRTIVTCFDLVELPASQPGLKDTYTGPTLAMLLELVQVCMQQHMDCFHVGAGCTWKAACTCAAGCGCCRCLPSAHVRPRPLQQQLLCTHQQQRCLVRYMLDNGRMCACLTCPPCVGWHRQQPHPAAAGQPAQPRLLHGAGVRHGARHRGCHGAPTLPVAARVAPRPEAGELPRQPRPFEAADGQDGGLRAACGACACQLSAKI